MALPGAVPIPDTSGKASVLDVVTLDFSIFLSVFIQK
jgi:hypothetical protein